MKKRCCVQSSIQSLSRSGSVDNHSGSSSNASIASQVPAGGSQVSTQYNTTNRDVKVPRVRAKRERLSKVEFKGKFRKDRLDKSEGGDEVHQLEELVKSTATRKSNYAHLLNFQFSSPGLRARGTADGWNQQPAFKKPSSASKPLDKQIFIHANCRFAVREITQDLATNADAVTEWGNIIQISLNTTEIPMCPICLDIPTAARMTKCGHVYCFPCALHLLALSDRSWVNCPICFDMIRESDLKSVVSHRADRLGIGDQITLQLMMRHHGAVSAWPCDSEVDWRCPPAYSLSEFGVGGARFSKYFSCSHSEQTEIILQPILDELLQKRDGQEHDDYEAQYLASAIERTQSELELVSEQARIASSESTQLPVVDESSVDDNSKLTWFYQISDGQPVFLSHFNTKCLLKEYGSMESCPRQISGRIVEMTEHRVDEAFRKRHKFLSHVPISSVVKFCEVNLKPPILSKHTLSLFSDEIEQKRLALERKKREEKRREKKITRELEQKLYPSSRGMRCGLGEDQFPSFAVGEPEYSLADDGESVRLSETGTSQPASPIWPVEPSMSFTRPSFASALMTPECSSSSPPSVWGRPPPPPSVRSTDLSTPAAGAHAPLKPTTSYGEKMNLVEKVAGSGGASLRGGGGSHEDGGGDLDLPAPTYSESFSQAFDRALSLKQVSAAAAGEVSEADGGGLEGGGKRGKKKKANKQLLFSNSISFAR